MVEQDQFVDFFSDFVPTTVNSSFFSKVTQPDLKVTLRYNFNRQEDMILVTYICSFSSKNTFLRLTASRTDVAIVSGTPLL